MEELNSFNDLDIPEKSSITTFKDFFTEKFKKFLLSEGFKYELCSCYLNSDIVPQWEDGDDKSWTKHCGSEDGSWYNTIFIRQNRIEVCSEIECGGMFSNETYWEYHDKETFKEAYNNSIKWLKSIKECL